MPLPDSSDIDAAVIALLRNDATLKGLAPDGVWFDQADEGKQRFVIVSLADHRDVGQFGPPQKRRAFEDLTYLVKSVERITTTGSNSKAAAARIDALLEDAALTIPGYTGASVTRVAHVRETENDELDATIKWAHRGGHYRVMASPT